MVFVIFVMADSKIKFKKLQPIFNLNSNNISLRIIDFRSFNIMDDAGFNWKKSNGELICSELDFLYLRSCK